MQQQGDDPFLAEARRQAQAPSEDDPFLAEARRQAGPAPLMRAAPIRATPPLSLPAPQRAAADVSFARPTPTPEPPLPPPTPEVDVPSGQRAEPVYDRFGEQTGTRPALYGTPSIYATERPNFMQRLLQAAAEQVSEKYRSKSAAPGAPSALPRPEREALRQVEQVRTYGEAAGRAPEEMQQNIEQDLVDLAADEGKWSRQLGTMLGDFVDPAMLAGGVAGERAAMLALENMAARGAPGAIRILELARTPAGAPLVRRLVARTVHGMATGGAANVGFQTVGAAEEGRVPSPLELGTSFAVGTLLTPALEGAGTLAGAPFRPRGPAPKPDINAVGSEAARITALGDKATPRERARLADLHQQLQAEDARMAREEPPPPIEQSAAAEGTVDLMKERLFTQAPFQRPEGIVRMPVAEITADPQRFQFKQLGTQGVSGELKGVTHFNEQLAGVVSVWRDPADGRVYVVNGHHRLELAKRLGKDQLNVQFIDAPTAEAARAEGAFINIAEGRGTATDVAKFLRDLHATPADLEARGISLKGDLSRDGLALSKLAPDVFDQVATAQVPQGWGVAIGQMLDDPVLQREALKAVRGSGKRLTQAEVVEVARQVRDAGTEGVSQENLFGTTEEQRGLFIQRAQLAAAVKKRLATDKRLFGYVAKEGRAEELSRAGGTKIDVEAAKGLAEGSAQSEEVFDRLYTRSGPLADLMNEGARRIARGEKPSTVLADIYPGIGDAVGRELTESGARPHGGERPVPEEPRSLADEIAGQEEGRVADSADPDQAGMFSPARERERGYHPTSVRDYLPDDTETRLGHAAPPQSFLALSNRLTELENALRSASSVEAVDRIANSLGHVNVRASLAQGARKPTVNTAQGVELLDRSMALDRLVARRRGELGPASPLGKQLLPIIARQPGLTMVEIVATARRRMRGAVASELRDAVDHLIETGRVERTWDKGGTPHYRAAPEPRAAPPEPAPLVRQEEFAQQRTDPIVAAAIKGPDGKIYRGATHGEAANALEDAGFAAEAEAYRSSPSYRPSLPEGFVTKSGEFVTREALQKELGRRPVGELMQLGAKPIEGDADQLALLSPSRPSRARELQASESSFELRPEPEPEPPSGQASLFGAREGTAESRKLAQMEAAARGEIENLRARLALEKEPSRRAALSRDIAEREKLVNRGGAISAEEMQHRAAAADAQPDVMPTGDQMAFLSPDVPPALRSKIEQTGGKVPVDADVQTLMEISQNLAEAVGVPLRQGRFRAAARKALGVFFPFKETTRVTRFDKLDTVSHEVGHYISKKYLKNPTMRSDNFRGAGRQPLMLPKEAARELVQMGRDLYGDRRPAGGYGEEGIAEWTSFYVTEPHTLAQKAPTFTAWMDGILAQEPMLKTALLQAREAYRVHQQVPATARFDAQISVGEKQRAAFTVRDYMRHVADDTYDIRAAVQDLGTRRPPSEDAAVLARLSRGAWGEAMEWLQRGVRELGTADERMNEGIVKTLGDLVRSGRAQEFRRYVDAESALERWDRGIDPGFSREDAQAIVDLYKNDPAIRKAGEAAWAHSQALLKLRHQVGLLTDLSLKQISEANQRRVGFYRIFEPEETGASRGFGGRGGLGSSGLHSQKGSARRVIDPIEAIIRDTYVTAKKVREHQAKRALVEHALATEGGGKVVEQVPAPQRPVTIPLEKLQQQLRDLGLVKEAIDAKTGERFTVELGGPGGAELDGIVQAFQDAHVAGGAEAKDLVFPMLMKGELKWFQVRDKATYDALVGLGPVELDIWRRVFSGPKRLLQTGATATLEWGLGNLPRDAFAQSIFSHASWRPPLWRHMEGLYHMLTHDPVYQRFKLGGADQATMGASERGTTQLEMRRLFGYFRTLKQAWLDRKAAWSRATPIEKGLYVLNDLERVVLSPFEALRTIKEGSETMGRVGEYAALERQALKKGARPVDAQAEAALGARDVGIDFQQLGSTTREVNHVVAFFGAWLRGWAQLGRELKTRPHIVIPRMVAEITVPSLALYYLQRDDPVYQDMPSWKRDLFWVYVDRGDDQGEGWDGYGSGKVQHVWMFPKPFELGLLFGTLPERMAAWRDGRDKDFARNMRDLVGRMAPPWIPTAAVPLIENYGNRSTFRDRPVFPRRTEGLDPSEQVNPQTGETARVLGRAMGYSPAKIENLVRGWTGGAGMYLMSGSNAIVRFMRAAEGLPPLKAPRPESDDRLLDIPGLRRFLSRVPAEDSESVERLYQDFQKAEQHRQTWRAMLKDGRQVEAARYLDAHRAEIMAVASSEELGQGQRGPLREAYLQMQKMQELKRLAQAAGSPQGRQRAVDAIRRLAGAVEDREP